MFLTASSGIAIFSKMGPASAAIGLSPFARQELNKVYHLAAAGNTYNSAKHDNSYASDWEQAGMFMACRTGYYLYNPGGFRKYDMYWEGQIIPYFSHQR